MAAAAAAEQVTDAVAATYFYSAVERAVDQKVI